MRPLLVLFTLAAAIACRRTAALDPLSVAPDQVMFRIAEVDVRPADRERYLAIALEQARIAVATEPGVISIFPFVDATAPNTVRILEIYASRAAYEAHLASAHFQHYKTSTLEMVAGLRLIDMRMLAPELLGEVFRKAHVASIARGESQKL